MDEFVEFSSQDSSTSTIPGNFTINPPTHSPGISAFNKYVIIGVLSIFLTLLLITIFVHLVKSKFLARDTSVLYAQVTSDAETTSLDGSDDDLDQLYTTCQLHVVDDDELITAGTGFEYDSSSLDGGLSSTQRKLLVNVLRGDIQSNTSN